MLRIRLEKKLSWYLEPEYFGMSSWQGCGIELELAFKKTQELGIELELAFEKTHELGIKLELAFATNSPTETKFPSMSGILIEITASSCHLDNLITHY